MFCSQILINVLSRQFFAFPFNGRYVFGDCKYKHKYRGFYEKYKEIIEEYNNGKDINATKKAFDDLSDFLKTLSKEEVLIDKEA